MTAGAELRLMLTAIDVREIVDYCQLLLTKVIARPASSGLPDGLSRRMAKA